MESLESVELRLRAGNSRLQRGFDMLEKSADQEIEGLTLSL